MGCIQRANHYVQTSNAKVYRSDVVLTSGDDNDALVLIPAENAEYADVANALYLAPNGFDGTATVFLTPQAANEVAGVAPGVQALVQAIEADYTAGDLSAADPLYVFGYSEGAVEEGLAEPQLAAFGIPTDDLHFLMVGDSASAEGGFSQFVHRLSSRIRATVHHRAFRTAGRNFSGAGRHDPR
jgi:hypothetical protein